MTSPLDVLPIWATGLVLFIALCAAGEIAHRLHPPHDTDASADEGYVLTATLGLLALLIGFTFSLSLSRYEARRDLVLHEANAIGTAWLRADLAPEPYRGQLRAQLRQYVDARLALATASEDPKAIAAAEARADVLQRQIWATAIGAEPNVQPPTLAPLLVSSINETIDLGAARKAELAARLPTRVLGVLIVYAVLSAGMIGYVLSGAASTSRAPAAILFLLLSIAITLLLDLDRPRTGGVTVSQTPLVDVRTMMSTP